MKTGDNATSYADQAAANAAADAGNTARKAGVDAALDSASSGGIVGNPDWPTPLSSQQGQVICGELDQLGRPTGVSVTITQQMIGTGSDAAQRIRPPGFGGQAAGHARGHLFGNQLGGSGTDPRNLVTLFQNPANHPMMSGFEAQVRAAVESGQTVNYWAIPVYEGSNLIPIGVTLRARGSGGFNLDVSIINRSN